MVGRTRFVGDVLYSIGVSGFIYPIFGHWCWGPDGFLATMGSQGHLLSGLGMNLHDFAGSTLVHSIGGWVAIAGAIMLGPRLGRKFKRDGGGPMLPHDLTIAVIGGLILWIGWYGFNPCSTLSIMDAGGVGRVAMNTTLAACTGGLAAELVVFFMGKKWDEAAMLNGFLAGLVAITCPCIVPKSADALTGLFYGGGTKVLTAQAIGSLVVCSATFASAMAMFAALKAVGLLRVSADGEQQGLDLDQHGISAYPEYVISALAAPHGMSPDTVGSGNLARAPESTRSSGWVGSADLVGSK